MNRDLKRHNDDQNIYERMAKKARLELDERFPQIVRHLLHKPRHRLLLLFSCLIFVNFNFNFNEVTNVEDIFAC